MAIYLSMFFYCLVVMFFIHRADSKRKRLVYEVSILILLGFVAGFSDLLEISDMQVYQMVYKVTPTLGDFQFSTIHSIYGTFNMDKGFLLLVSVLKTLHISFRGFLILHTVFFLGAFYYGVRRYTEDFAMVAVVFLYKIYFYNCFISMRQSITIAIFCIILRYMEEKRIVPYMVGCLIAAQFHFAALLLIPVYFLTYFRITRKRMAVLIVGCTAVSVVINMRSVVLFVSQRIPSAALRQKLVTYLVEDSSSLQIFHTLEYLVIMALVLIFFEQIVKKNEHAEFMLKLMLVLLPILTLFRSMSGVTRLKDYFTIFYGVIFAYFYKLDKQENRVLIYAFAIGLSLFGYVRYILSFGGGTSLLPYKNIIFEYLGIG